MFKSSRLFSFLVVVNFAVGIEKSILQNSVKLRNVEVLDDNGKFILGWELTDSGDEILFEIVAETLGYVGFGISPQGGMLGADIFIAGVHTNGTPYFSDRFGTGFSEPKIDTHSDWKLLEAMEFSISGKTILKFSRLLNTCDEEDYPIGNDTNRLIWALGATDKIEYHTADRRGTKSTNLLHAEMPDLDLDKVKTWPLTLNMEMPSLDTSYWCSFHKGPTLDKRHHVVGFDALLESTEALKHTHHFILYNCYLPPGSNQTMDEIFGNYTVENGVLGGHCYESGDLPIWNCAEYIYIWAKGGKRMVFPENVGYPIGEEVGNQYYMMEIHYDNPEMLSNVKFATGGKFYYTEELRYELPGLTSWTQILLNCSEVEAGLLTLGHAVDVTLTVPPNTPDYKVVGHCSPGCVDLFPSDGITIFNSLLHSHLSGRKIKTRHFRGEVELPWLSFDDHYDFDYQQNKPLMEHIKVQKGDQLTVECTYDSTWKGGEAVIGGMSTREEMCEDIVWYYPKYDIDVCTSTYYLDAHMSELGIAEYHTERTNVFLQYIIDEPEYLRGDYLDSISFKLNWTKEFQAEYSERHQTGIHQGMCIIQNQGQIWEFPISYPENLIPYLPEDKCSSKWQTNIS